MRRLMESTILRLTGRLGAKLSSASIELFSKHIGFSSASIGLTDALKVLPLLLLFAGCVRGTWTPEFLEDSTLRLEQKHATVFVYDSNTCQTSFNRDRCEFGVFDDTMSEFYFVTLDEFPTAENQKINASLLTWTTEPGLVETRRNIEVQVLRLDSTTIWLWSPRESLRFTVWY